MKRKLTVVFLFSCLFFVSCSKANKTITCNPIYAMDTVINVTFYNIEDANTHYKKIKSIYDEVDGLTSDFNRDGKKNLCYDLNKNRECDYSATLFEILEYAEELSKDTDGYFNPYIGKISHEIKEYVQNEKAIDFSLFDGFIEESIHTTYIVENEKIKLIGDGNIDLGAIAKGYATKKAKEYLDDIGIHSYYIDAGNSSIALGEKENGFKVGLSHPYKDSYIGVVENQNICISSSSPKYQYRMLENEKIHHIINPKTGYPSNIYDAVFVLNDDAMAGDVYSTALFSMEIEEAKSFAKAHDLKIILFKDDKLLFQSEGVNLHE